MRVLQQRPMQHNEQHMRACGPEFRLQKYLQSETMVQQGTNGLETKSRYPGAAGLLRGIAECLFRHGTVLHCMFCACAGLQQKESADIVIARVTTGLSKENFELPSKSSLYLSVYLSIYLSIYRHRYPSMYLSIYPSIYLSTYVPIYLSFYLCIDPCNYLYSMYLCTWTYILIYLSLPLSLSVYISVYIYV